MMRRPPRSTLLPCTTLVRSGGQPQRGDAVALDLGRPPAGEGPLLVPQLGVALGVVVVQQGDAELGEQAEAQRVLRSEEHTSELQSRQYIVCRLLLEKKQRCT